MTALTPTLRRFLVALDASPHSLAALEAAVALAAQAGAELVGLFVEDADLLRMGEHGFARVTDPTGRVTRGLSPGEMERAVQRLEEQARRELARVADRAKVRWTLRVARGRVTPEVLAASEGVDLLCVGCAGRAPHRRRRLGSTAREVAAHGPAAVLLVAEGQRVRGPVAVAYDGSAPADRALDLAAALLPATDRSLLLVLPPGGPSEETLARARAQAAERGIEARPCRALAEGPEALVASLLEHRAGVLLLPVDGRHGAGDVEAIVRGARIPVILVR